MFGVGIKIRIKNKIKRTPPVTGTIRNRRLPRHSAPATRHS